jgi:arylsulfatase A-like enzyme
MIVFISQARKPNILFIEVDDLEYEYLGLEGSPVIKTPHVDRLAQEGVYFSNAVAQGMMCGPSRNSLMTGLYPHNLGFYYNGQMRALPQGVWTFPQALQRAGYYTAWIGKCHIRPFIGEGSNKTEAMKTEMGFDHVQQTVGRAVLCKQLKNGKELKNDWYVGFLRRQGMEKTFVDECGRTSTLPDEVYLDGFFTRAAKDFLNSYDEKKPFFLWLNYSVPHGPYDVPEQYHTFDPEDMPGGTQVKNFTAPEGLVRKTKLAKNEEQIKKTQAGF